MKQYLLRVSAGFLLLFLALYGCFFSLIGTFGLPADRPVLLAVLAGAALLWSLVLHIPRPWLRRVAVLLILAVLAFVCWRSWERLLGAAQLGFYQISYRYHQIVPSIYYYLLPPGFSRWLLATSASRVITGLAAALAVLLGGWFGLWFIRLGVYFPGYVTAALFPAVGLAVLLEPPLLPMAALVMLVALTLLCARPLWQRPQVGALRVWGAFVPLAVVLGLVLALVPPAEYVRSPRAERWRAAAMSWQWDAGLTLGAGNSDRPRPAAAAPPADGGLTVADAGPLRFTGRVDLTVEGLPQGLHLLRGFSAAVYGEDGWSQLDDLAYAGLALPAASLSFPGDAFAELYAAGAPSDVTVTLEAAAPYLYTPYFTASAGEADPYRDAYLSPREDAAQLAVYPDLIPGQNVFLSPTSLAEYEALYRVWVYRNYLQVPDDLRDDLQVWLEDMAPSQSQTAREKTTETDHHDEPPMTAPAAPDGETPYASTVVVDEDGSTYTITIQGPEEDGLPAYSYVYTIPTAAAARDPLAAAQAVAAYLAAYADYDQGAPLTPEGEDFVAYFMNESRRGYCLHYASAATLMLRAMGVPARFVSGYAVPVADPTGVVPVRDYCAHAWVEVYVDDFGWYPVDVTPTNSAALQAPASPSATPSPEASLPPETAPTPTPAPSQGPGQTGSGPSILWAKLLPWAGAAAALAALLVLLWLQARLRLRRRDRAMAQPDPNRAAVAAYRYLAALERRAGVALPSLALELAKKASFSQHVLSAREREQMDTLVKEARQSARSQTGAFGRLLLRYLWALA